MPEQTKRGRLHCGGTWKKPSPSDSADNNGMRFCIGFDIEPDSIKWAKIAWPMVKIMFKEHFPWLAAGMGDCVFLCGCCCDALGGNGLWPRSLARTAVACFASPPSNARLPLRLKTMSSGRSLIPATASAQLDAVIRSLHSATNPIWTPSPSTLGFSQLILAHLWTSPRTCVYLGGSQDRCSGFEIGVGRSPSRGSGFRSSGCSVLACPPS